MTNPPPLRFYRDLAEWWPLISPPEEYREGAAILGDLLASGDRTVETVLELGSGGGHNASYLAARYRMTLVDISPGMLAVSQTLNPGCEHVIGDMRTVRLGRRFDAVLIHDAIDYMTILGDLAAAITTAAEHCRPGGVVVLAPDHVAETFRPSTGHGGSDAPDGRGVRYLEWSWDPDPGDSTIVTEYAFLMRDREGRVDAVNERHVTGLFPREAWLELMVGSGLDPRREVIAADPTATPRDVFVGVRPDA